MAIIKLGDTVTGIRGSIGGVTYSANSSSLFAKSWKRSPLKRTYKQSTQRSNFSNQAVAWAALSAAQKTSWDTYAAGTHETVYNSLGEVITLNGFQWFVKLSARKVFVGGTADATAPVGSLVTAPLLFVLSADLSAGITVASNIGGLADSKGIISMSFGRGAGTTAAPTKYAWCATWSPWNTTGLTITSSVAALFGTINEGDRLYAKLERQRTTTGERAVPLYSSASVVP